MKPMTRIKCRLHMLRWAISEVLVATIFVLLD